MYLHGVLGLEQRAHAEQMYFATCQPCTACCKPARARTARCSTNCNEKLADKYFLNFSLFQSMPDVWAIDQIFPIVPLHRLDEAPTRRAVIAGYDLRLGWPHRSLRRQRGRRKARCRCMHCRRRTLLLGIFLIGAYQEILGDMHNLFGDTDAVNVTLNAKGGYDFSQPERGDTIDELLRYVHFDTDALRAAYHEKIAAANLSGQERVFFTQALEDGLTGYTYLED